MKLIDLEGVGRSRPFFQIVPIDFGRSSEENLSDFG